MALSNSQLKEKFVTGAIPTQQDFANLIDGMLSMPWYHLSDTHRVIKNDLVEEHFFITTDGSTRAYFKIVHATENDTFPIVSEAIRIGVSHGAITTYNYILISIANIDAYKEELNAILDSADLKTTQLLNFVNKYMRDINVTN